MALTHEELYMKIKRIAVQATNLSEKTKPTSERVACDLEAVGDMLDGLANEVGLEAGILEEGTLSEVETKPKTKRRKKP